ncbi:hypothetical protein SPHINGOAX6_70592 [Sphingomonas sp. AX6]|nr:hypothetical protein SPHINGOAX6_70592 [Sphingomonas sp. AX6]
MITPKHCYAKSLDGLLSGLYTVRVNDQFWGALPTDRFWQTCPLTLGPVPDILLLREFVTKRTSGLVFGATLGGDKVSVNYLLHAATDRDDAAQHGLQA